MLTNHDNPEPAPNTAVGTQNTDQAPEHAAATAGVSEPADEIALLDREGLPTDAIVLVPSVGPTPMRIPYNLVGAVVGDVEDAQSVRRQ